MNRLGTLATLGAMAFLWAAPSATALTVNGDKLSGPHFNLTILGSKDPKNAYLIGSNRHTIFVPLVTTGDPPFCPPGSTTPCTEPDGVSPESAIYLTPGPFQVCDGNAAFPPIDCNGMSVPIGKGPTDGAVFQLPCDTDVSGLATPCSTTGTSVAKYDIFAKELGKPGGAAVITTCATDIVTGEVVCSTSNVVAIRSKGKPTFDDVTAALTTISCNSTTCGVTLCPSGTCIFPLFNTNFTGFFWDYDNNGLKNLQVRFYME